MESSGTASPLCRGGAARCVSRLPLSPASVLLPPPFLASSRFLFLLLILVLMLFPFPSSYCAHDLILPFFHRSSAVSLSSFLRSYICCFPHLSCEVSSSYSFLFSCLCCFCFHFLHVMFVFLSLHVSLRVLPPLHTFLPFVPPLPSAFSSVSFSFSSCSSLSLFI